MIKRFYDATICFIGTVMFWTLLLIFLLGGKIHYESKGGIIGYIIEKLF